MTHLVQSPFCNGRISLLTGPKFLYKHFARFPFNKNSSLKFRKIHVTNGTVHYSRTDQTKGIASLAIVLVSRIQMSGPGVRPTRSKLIHIGKGLAYIAKSTRSRRDNYNLREGWKGSPPTRDRFSPYKGN